MTDNLPSNFISNSAALSAISKCDFDVCLMYINALSNRVKNEFSDNEIELESLEEIEICYKYFLNTKRGLYLFHKLRYTFNNIIDLFGRDVVYAMNFIEIIFCGLKSGFPGRGNIKSNKKDLVRWCI